MKSISEQVIQAAAEPESKTHPWWNPIWEFLIHAFMGTLLFSIIALPAIGLSIFVLWLEMRKVSQPILWGLTACEYLLFGADMLLFVVFILRQSWKAIKNLW